MLPVKIRGEKKTKELFIDYLKQVVNFYFYCSYFMMYTTLGTTLKYIFFGQACESIPPAARSCLPQANACFGKLKIPTIHTQLDLFTAKLDQGISLSLD